MIEIIGKNLYVSTVVVKNGRRILLGLISDAPGVIQRGMFYSADPDYPISWLYVDKPMRDRPHYHLARIIAKLGPSHLNLLTPSEGSL